MVVLSLIVPQFPAQTVDTTQSNFAKKMEGFKSFEDWSSSQELFSGSRTVAGDGIICVCF